jgi:hypothetical protein
MNYECIFRYGDIIIHLYKSNKKDLLFSSINKLFIYQYLLETELKNKSLLVYEEVNMDIKSGRINLVTNADLIKMGIKGLFEEYKESNKYLFDIGELHAIALAKAMGIVAFVSDDTKDEGPHQILVKELIEGVMPFSFYELLLLKYLDSQISMQEMFDSFEEINVASMSSHPMNFRTSAETCGVRGRNTSQKLLAILTNIILSNRFKKNLKQCIKYNLDISNMNAVVEILLAGKQLPEKYQNHSLSGN